MSSFCHTSVFVWTVYVVGIVPHHSYIMKLNWCWHQTVIFVWYKRTIAIRKFQPVVHTCGERREVERGADSSANGWGLCSMYSMTQSYWTLRSAGTARFNLHGGKATEKWPCIISLEFAGCVKRGELWLTRAANFKGFTVFCILINDFSCECSIMDHKINNCFYFHF